MSSPHDDAALDRLARQVPDSLLEGCQVVGYDWRYLYVNDAVVRQARRSREELIGRTMMECYPGIEDTTMFARLRQCMTERTHDSMDNEFSYPDGAVGWFEIRFVPVPEGVCVLSLDVTDRRRSEAALKRTEEQLRHAQKMEAVGKLAGAVAHDFNNLLSVVLTYSEMVLKDLGPDNPFRGEIEAIHRAGQRAGELTGQLMAFSRQQVVEPKVIDLNHVIAGLDAILRRLLGAGVELTVLPSVMLGKVKADRGGAEQVIVNIAVNARDAMPTGGMLTIETRNVDLDEDYVRDHFEVQPGPYVMLAVSDTGTGMDKATVPRIFEPFFTTKVRGKGTGLGLATVFGIVKQSGGHIWVYSEPGKGTTFKVYFPRLDDAALDPPAPPLPPVANGNETILLVEDDEQVRGVARTILRRAGYRVLDAANAGEALLICERHTATIHLLVTDIVLPRLNGRELAKRLIGLRPSMKVLFMSGYADEAVMQHGVIDSDVAYLQKPLTPDGLRRKVREVLDDER